MKGHVQENTCAFTTSLRVSVFFTSSPARSMCSTKFRLDQPSLKINMVSENIDAKDKVSRCVRVKKIVNQTVENEPFPSNLKKPRYHWRVPFIGIFLDRLLFNVENPDLARKYGSVYVTDFLGRKFFMITSHAGVTNAFRNTKQFCSQGAFPPNFHHLLGPDVLMTVDGTAHASRRRSLAPAMASSLFPLYCQTVEQSAHTLWKVSIRASPNQPLDIADAIRKHYFRVFVCMSTGLATEGHMSTKNHHNISEETFTDFVKGFASLRIGHQWSKAMKAKKQLLESLRNIIQYRLQYDAHAIDKLRAISDTQNQMHRLKQGEIDFLSLLIASSPLKTGNARKYTSNEDAHIHRISNEILLLWFSAYSTQSAGTLSAVAELGNDGNIWDLLVEEQQNVDHLSYNSVGKSMPILQSFILEVLRLRPPVALWYRKTSEPTIVDDIPIPGDAFVGLDLWAAQRDPKVFVNPDSFQYDRFLQSCDTSLPPSTVLSFGVAGQPHYCLGSKLAILCMSVTLAVLLRSYKLEIVPPPSKIYRPIPELVPRDGVKVRSCTKKTCLNV